jgi:hypothetical protein
MSLIRDLPPPVSSQYGITVDVGDDGTETETVTFECSREIPQEATGSMYVLAAEAFEPAGRGQFVSHEPVRPMYVIQTRPSDFPYPIKKMALKEQ